MTWECQRCSKLGVYDKTVVLQINGRGRDIDPCLAPIVAALNEGGVPTLACCCGHGDQDGNIMLQDGRVLKVRTWKEPKR